MKLLSTSRLLSTLSITCLVGAALTIVSILGHATDGKDFSGYGEGMAAAGIGILALASAVPLWIASLICHWIGLWRCGRCDVPARRIFWNSLLLGIPPFLIAVVTLPNLLRHVFAVL
jgi:hypothetical protein